MRTRSLLIVLAAILAAPTPSEAQTPVDCGDDLGREHLTVGSRSFTFEAPTATAPELADTYAQTGPVVSHHRTAEFRFVADVAPFEYGLVSAQIEWDLPSDYDLYMIDEFGDRRGQADTSNFEEGGTTSEQFTGSPVFHCESIAFLVRNWAGAPNQPIALTIDVTGGDTMLACAADDPAPGCAGKVEGEAPDPVADTRTRLYLGGDPGQATMAGPTVGDEYPFASHLTEERPTTGTPNQHTRPLVGFRDPDAGSAFENPFIAHFSIPPQEPLEYDGDRLTAMVWVSSPVADATTKIYADLYGDGALAASSIVTGDALANLRDPTALFFSFDNVQLFAFDSLTLQVATNPVATSNATVGNPSDGLLTVWYGSVQYQSRLTLPAA